MTAIPGWPHKLEDYPPKYVAFMKERHLYDDAEVLKHFADMGEEPADAPYNVIGAKTGQFVRLEHGSEPKALHYIYLGKAWDEMAFNEQGEVYFEYQTGEETEVAEKMNYARTMFKSGCGIMAWNAHDESEAALTHYFLTLYDKADMATWKLKYGGA